MRTLSVIRPYKNYCNRIPIYVKCPRIHWTYNCLIGKRKRILNVTIANGTSLLVTKDAQ